MICSGCGHWNEDEEPRCAHCGRRINREGGSSWRRSGLETDDSALGPSLVQRSGTSARAWRHEISRKLDEYRDRQKANAAAVPALGDAPGEVPRSSQSPASNVISIDRALARPEPSSSHGESELSEGASIPVLRREEAAESEVSSPILPPLGASAGAVPAEPIAADRVEVKARRGCGEAPCRSRVAPLQIRTLAGVLDLAVVVVALGTFLAVFHWLGGSLLPDKEGFRALGITSFVLLAFYWVFYVGHFGETPGMTWLGLRLLNFYGQKPTGRQRAARALGLILSSATMGLGFAWSLADEDQLTWHDRMSRTLLTRDGAADFRLQSGVAEARPRRLPDLPPPRQV